MYALVSPRWLTVREAKEELESLQKQAIPQLLALLDRSQRIELKETMQLLYPGAKTLPASGDLVDYDIDWIAVRAGWVLEKLTFQQFGFREGLLNVETLMQAAREGKTGQPMAGILPQKRSEEEKARRRAEAAARAREWWKVAGSSWTRFGALRDALRSDNPRRQEDALNWLKSGKTQCAGFGLRRYQEEIQPEIERLRDSPHPYTAAAAKEILGQVNKWWLKHNAMAERFRQEGAAAAPSG